MVKFITHNILGTRWIGSSRINLAVVAFESLEHKGEWVATIGRVPATYIAAQEVIARGARLLPLEAHGFFPELDITKYEKYDSLATAVR